MSIRDDSGLLCNASPHAYTIVPAKSPQSPPRVPSIHRFLLFRLFSFVSPLESSASSLLVSGSRSLRSPRDIADATLHTIPRVSRLRVVFVCFSSSAPMSSIFEIPPRFATVSAILNTIPQVDSGPRRVSSVNDSVPRHVLGFSIRNSSRACLPSVLSLQVSFRLIREMMLRPRYSPFYLDRSCFPFMKSV